MNKESMEHEYQATIKDRDAQIAELKVELAQKHARLNEIESNWRFTELAQEYDDLEDQLAARDAEIATLKETNRDLFAKDIIASSMERQYQATIKDRDGMIADLIDRAHKAEGKPWQERARQFDLPSNAFSYLCPIKDCPVCAKAPVWLYTQVLTYRSAPVEQPKPEPERRCERCVKLEAALDASLE